MINNAFPRKSEPLLSRSGPQQFCSLKTVTFQTPSLRFPCNVVSGTRQIQLIVYPPRLSRASQALHPGDCNHDKQVSTHPEVGEWIFSYSVRTLKLTEGGA